MVASSSSVIVSSSSVEISSSSEAIVSGDCLPDPLEVYVGDVVEWTYSPDNGTVRSGNFHWYFDQDAAPVAAGSEAGEGKPKVKVVYSVPGVKTMTELEFEGKVFQCSIPLTVLGSLSSSSEELESSSSENGGETITSSGSENPEESSSSTQPGDIIIF